MPVSTCKRILAPSLHILAMSLLHITGELMLPLLVNLLSNDVYNVLQSCLSLRMRFLIVTMLIILFIVPPVTIKDKGLLLPLFVVFKDKRLLLPLFKVFKSRPDPLIEPLIEQCTHSEFTRPDDPLRNDPDVLGILNMLHSCRDEMLHHSLVQIAQRVHTKAQVPDVEAALQSDYTTYRSRVLHRMVEIGPQTGNLDLDNLSLQIAKAMRRARQIDENCTLQFGCFALLKYKDGELKWWRLQEHWTPKIDEISCFPLNILDFFTGHRSQWIVRGSNLENAMLEASTANDKEEIAILSRRKLDNDEDLLWCAEPDLIWRSALLFWKGVYICAFNSINDPKEGLDFDLQSESKNVTKVYWTAVAESLRPSPRTLMFTIANLLSLGISFSLGYISQGMIVFLILSYWWLAAKPGPPIGGLERIPTLGEDLTNSHSPSSLPSIDHLLEDTSNNSGPANAPPVMPSQGEGDSAQLSSDGPQMRPDDSKPASMVLTLRDNFIPQNKASKEYKGDHKTGGHNPQGRPTRKIQGKDRDPASMASKGEGGGAGPNSGSGKFSKSRRRLDRSNANEGVDYDSKGSIRRRNKAHNDEEEDSHYSDSREDWPHEFSVHGKQDVTQMNMMFRYLGLPGPPNLGIDNEVPPQMRPDDSKPASIVLKPPPRMSLSKIPQEMISTNEMLGSLAPDATEDAVRSYFSDDDGNVSEDSSEVSEAVLPVSGVHPEQPSNSSNGELTAGIGSSIDKSGKTEVSVSEQPKDLSSGDLSTKDEVKNPLKWLSRRAHSTSIYKPEHAPRAYGPEKSSVVEVPNRVIEPEPQTPEVPAGPKHPWTKGEQLGAGSFGTVYAALDSDGVFFAVKEVSMAKNDKQAQQSISQLMSKIELLSRFRHDNIVQYLGTEKGDGKLYIFLELVSRGSLAAVYRAIKLSRSQIIAYTRQILKGLKYLHDRNIVHGDIKCANILVDTKGICKLADFGIPKELDSLDKNKFCKGSAYWMAPELIDPKKASGLPADIWSLGCSIVEMATGSPPFREMEWYRVLWIVGHGNAPPIPDTLSETAKDFVKRCLDINPAKRPTAAELLLHPFVRQDVASTPTTTPELPFPTRSITLDTIREELSAELSNAPRSRDTNSLSNEHSSTDEVHDA